MGRGGGGGGALLLTTVFCFEVFVLLQNLCNMSALARQSQMLFSTSGVNFDCFYWASSDF